MEYSKELDFITDACPYSFDFFKMEKEYRFVAISKFHNKFRDKSLNIVNNIIYFDNTGIKSQFHNNSTVTSLLLDKEQKTLYSGDIRGTVISWSFKNDRPKQLSTFDVCKGEILKMKKSDLFLVVSNLKKEVIFFHLELKTTWKKFLFDYDIKFIELEKKSKKYFLLGADGNYLHITKESYLQNDEKKIKKNSYGDGVIIFNKRL